VAKAGLLGGEVSFELLLFRVELGLFLTLLPFFFLDCFVAVVLHALFLLLLFLQLPLEILFRPKDV